MFLIETFFNATKLSSAFHFADYRCIFNKIQVDKINKILEKDLKELFLAKFKQYSFKYNENLSHSF